MTEREVVIELLVFHKGMRGRVLLDGQKMVELMRSSRRERCASCKRPSEWRPLDMPNVRALCEECMTVMVVQHLKRRGVAEEKRS